MAGEAAGRERHAVGCRLLVCWTREWLSGAFQFNILRWVPHFALGSTFCNAVACPSLSGVQPLPLLLPWGCVFLHGKHTLMLAAPMPCWRCSVQSLVVRLQSVLLCTA